MHPPSLINQHHTARHVGCFNLYCKPSWNEYVSTYSTYVCASISVGQILRSGILRQRECAFIILKDIADYFSTELSHH